MKPISSIIAVNLSDINGHHGNNRSWYSVMLNLQMLDLPILGQVLVYETFERTLCGKDRDSDSGSHLLKFFFENETGSGTHSVFEQ